MSYLMQRRRELMMGKEQSVGTLIYSKTTVDSDYIKANCLSYDSANNVMTFDDLSSFASGKTNVYWLPKSPLLPICKPYSNRHGVTKIDNTTGTPENIVTTGTNQVNITNTYIVVPQLEVIMLSVFTADIVEYRLDINGWFENNNGYQNITLLPTSWQAIPLATTQQGQHGTFHRMYRGEASIWFSTQKVDNKSQVVVHRMKSKEERVQNGSAGGSQFFEFDFTDETTYQQSFQNGYEPRISFSPFGATEIKLYQL